MEMIDVCCCVFPDGTTFWTDDVQAGPSRAADAWRSTLTDARRAALDEAGATLGFVVVRMPAESYQAITATNSPMTMSYMDAEPAA